MRFSTMIRSAVRAVRSYFRRDWDLETLMNVINHVRPITPVILHHLMQMYLVLFWILTSFGIGFHFGLTGNIGGSGSCLFIVGYPRFGPYEQEIKFYILIIGAMVGGSLVGPCFRPFVYADFGIKVIITALMGTFAILGLSEAVRFQLFNLCDVLLYNPLRVGLVYIVALILAADYIEICNFIMWFVAYVALYSRMLVERIRNGDDDFVNHAITLFTDAPAVCIHMVDLVFWGALDYLKRCGRAVF